MFTDSKKEDSRVRKIWDDFGFEMETENPEDMMDVAVDIDQVPEMDAILNQVQQDGNGTESSFVDFNDILNPSKEKDGNETDSSFRLFYQDSHDSSHMKNQDSGIQDSFLDEDEPMEESLSSNLPWLVQFKNSTGLFSDTGQSFQSFSLILLFISIISVNIDIHSRVQAI